MRSNRKGKLPVMFALMFYSVCLAAQSNSIDADARRGIDAGNQQWVDAMKQGDVSQLGPGNAQDVVDCSPEGDCIRGRSALEQHMKDQMAKLGKADSASVTSVGSVQQGRYVYEWGEAKAHFPNGKGITDRYLTVWQKQSDGSWKVFRNLVMPEKYFKSLRDWTSDRRHRFEPTSLRAWGTQSKVGHPLRRKCVRYGAVLSPRRGSTRCSESYPGVRRGRGFSGATFLRPSGAGVPLIAKGVMNRAQLLISRSSR